MFGPFIRLIILGSFIIIAAPLQWIFVRLVPRRSGFLPLLTHRLFAFLFSLRIRESGTRPAKGVGVLILANHVSWLDIPVLGATFPVSFIAKSDIARWPVGGWLALLQRTIFIDRTRKTATVKTNTEIASRLQAGNSIVLFPEGTTGDGNRLLPFRASLVGAADLASQIESSVLIQPVALIYRKRNGLPLSRRDRPEIAWYGNMGFLSHFKIFLNAGPLDVDVIWCDTLSFYGTFNRKFVSKEAENAILRELFSKS